MAFTTITINLKKVREEISLLPNSRRFSTLSTSTAAPPNKYVDMLRVAHRPFSIRDLL